MNQFNNNPLSNTPDVVKNLLILNVIVYVATVFLFPQFYETLSMHFFKNEQFQPFQIVTHMFMHDRSGIMHIFFNMFSLWMFGSTLEKVWGPQRFLIFYLIAGLGSIFLYMAVEYVQWINLLNQFTPDQITKIYQSTAFGGELSWYNVAGNDESQVKKAVLIYHSSVVGASGAIFGILVAFGMLFPNTELMLLFFPVPVKAKFFIPIMIVLELVLGIGNFRWDNVAHFAHLGGALFGFIMVKLWSRDRSNFW
jgi:membrane associated rhomboid family serine protease